MTEPIIAHRRAFLALAAISLIWGYNWVVMKGALRFCDPFTFSTLRLSLGAIVLLAVLIWKRRRLFPGNAGLLILTGFLATTGGTGVSTWALQNGDAGKTAILVYTMPFWAMLIGWPILSERIRGMQWLAVGAALSGLTLILAPWCVQLDLRNSLLAVLSGLMWGGGSITLKILSRKRNFDLLAVTAWQMVLGAIPIGITAGMLPSAPIAWNPYLVEALVYNVFLATAVAGLLWFYCLQVLPTGAATMGTLATPVIGVLAAAIQLGERPTLSEIAGMMLILSGIALIAFLDMRRTRWKN